MENNVIDFLESKGASDELIKTSLSGVLSLDKVYKKLNFIYYLFGEIGLNDDEITLLLEKNRRMVVSMPKEDIIKIAYVLKTSDIEKSIFDSPSNLRNATFYTRIYVRRKTFENSGVNYKGSTVLLETDSKAYSMKFNMQKAVQNKFNIMCENDNELVSIYGLDALKEILQDRVYRPFLLKKCKDENINYNNSDELSGFMPRKFALDLKIYKEANEYFKNRDVCLDINQFENVGVIKK